MNNRNIKSISRVLILGAIVVMAAGCSKEAIEDIVELHPNNPGNGIHKFPPKKTITIKRKKPTIGNPSPRPLSADMPAEEFYEEYEE